MTIFEYIELCQYYNWKEYYEFKRKALNLEPVLINGKKMLIQSMCGAKKYKDGIMIDKIRYVEI